MSIMESPLEVLSRAATMVQDNANEVRLTTKELPTTKWRRDRRLRATEYHHSLTTSPTPPLSPQQLQQPIQSQSSNSSINGSIMRPLIETPQNSMVETPLDMSLASTGNKPRSPPPPYREPLPGSTFATALARPSVITQAPPKRDGTGHNIVPDQISGGNLEIAVDVPTDSNSVCDPVIDEHFRRSLGADYMNLFVKKSPQNSASPPNPQPSPQQPAKPHDSDEQLHPTKQRTMVTVNGGDSVSTSVDDHFAKALGDTWKKLQADKAKNDE